MMQAVLISGAIGNLGRALTQETHQGNAKASLSDSRDPMQVSFKLLVRDYYLLLRNIPEVSPLYAFLKNGAIVSDSSGCMMVQILCNHEQQAKILASLAQRICSRAVSSIEEGIKSASPRA
jgi:hypothetical protein